MSHTASSVEGLRHALCLECGSVRTARARYLGRGARPLRCESCGRSTIHAAVNWDGNDRREEANMARSEADARAMSDFESLMNLFHACHIDVLSDESDLTSPNAEPQGGLVDVVRWSDPEGYLVRLQRGLSLADRVHCLDWAWRSIRPSIARWHRCAIESDADGNTFQRIYNNELETGVFELS